MTKELLPNQKKLRRRILEIIHEVHGSHIGSCFNAVDIIDVIYSIKNPSEKFILSNGHAGVALYVVLEKNGLLKNPTLKTLHHHPDRNHKNNIDFSTGSLGQGLPAAIGMALANRKKNVYCLISDGECAEGSIWESLRLIAEFNLTNLKTVISVNGWGAYDAIKKNDLKKRVDGFGLKTTVCDGQNIKELMNILKKKNTIPTLLFAKTNSDQLPFLKGLSAHYFTMNEEDFKKGIKMLS